MGKARKDKIGRRGNLVLARRVLGELKRENYNINNITNPCVSPGTSSFGETRSAPGAAAAAAAARFTGADDEAMEVGEDEGNPESADSQNNADTTSK